MCHQGYGVWKIHVLLAMKKAQAAILESNLAAFGQIKSMNTTIQESYILVHTQRNSYSS